MNIKKLYVVPFLSLMCLSLGSWSFNDIVGKVVTLTTYECSRCGETKTE